MLSSLQSKHHKGGFITKQALVFQLLVSLSLLFCSYEVALDEFINGNNGYINSILNLIKQKGSWGGK